MPIKQFKTFREFEQKTKINTQFLRQSYHKIANNLEVDLNTQVPRTYPQVLYIDGITSTGKTTLL